MCTFETKKHVFFEDYFFLFDQGLSPFSTNEKETRSKMVGRDGRGRRSHFSQALQVFTLIALCEFLVFEM